MLTIADHRRDAAGLLYIYPVLSRRAGGVSLGINLNVNNACNWACLYCQVENLQRGGPPPVDLLRLQGELADFLDELLSGDYLQREVPEGVRRLVDVAFSGNGEPTAAAEFAATVEVARAVLAERHLLPQVRLRLITNGSLLHRAEVQRGIRLLGDAGGEVWFKLDRVGDAASRIVNGVPQQRDGVRQRLLACLACAPTWLQTCWFALDGLAPAAAEREAYCAFLQEVAAAGGRLAGVHLYGLARPSLQSGAERLGRLGEQELLDFASEIETKTGIRVLVNP